MSFKLNEQRPEKGLIITHTEDEKFKVEAVVIRFITPLDEIKSQRYTVLVSLLSESSGRYNEKSRLAKKLVSLYGASLHSFSYRVGNSLVSGLTVNSIGDKYTINGENITEECAHLLLECIFEPDIKDGKFNEQYFESKKKELIDKIKSSSNNRHSYAITKARETAFEGELSSISALGTLENAEKLTNAQLADSYKELLETAFISISFCGGGTNKAAQKLVTERFCEFASTRNYIGEDITSLNAPSVCKKEPKYKQEKIEQAQSKLIMIFKTESENIWADKLACAMLGSTPFSKLFLNVREKLSLCYYCQSSIINCKNAMIIDSGVGAGNEKTAEKEILYQLNELKNGIFSDEDIENTKKYLKGAIISNYDSAEDLNAWYFAEFAKGDEESPNEAIEKLEAVTREDICMAANGFMLDTVYLLVPEESEGGEDDE